MTDPSLPRIRRNVDDRVPRPCRSMVAITARVAKNVPLTLTAITSSQSAPEISSTGITGMMPAQLTSTSTLPWRDNDVLDEGADLRVRTHVERTPLGGAPRGPNAPLRAPATPAASMSVATTSAPAAANRRAIASPIPRAAPVTSATFPSIRTSTSDSSGYTGCRACLHGRAFSKAREA